MFELNLKGIIELEEPEDFIKDFQELLKKYKTEFRGNSSIFKIPDYVDYQRIEESSDSGDPNVQE